MVLITLWMPNAGIELIISMLLLLQLASCRNDTFPKAQLSKVLVYLSLFFECLSLGCTSEDVIIFFCATREEKYFSYSSGIGIWHSTQELVACWEIPLVRTGWLAVGPAWQRLPMKTFSVDSSPALLQFRFKADWQRIRVLSVPAAPTDTALNSSPARRPYPERTATSIAVANRTTSRGRARLP